MPGVSASSLIPLQKLLELSTSHPAAVRVPAIIDAILAHPIHSPVISQIISNVFNESPDSIEIWRIDVLPELINQTKAGGQKDVVLAVKLMLGMIRAHDELIGLTLEVSEEVLRGLSMAYSKLGEDDRKTRTGVSEEIRLGAMEDVLMICKELITRVGMEGAAGDAMLRFLGENESAAMGVMQGKSLRGDCEALWGKNGRKFSPDSVIIGKLQKKRDDLAKLDPRVMSILAIFPTIPPHLLLIALSHPQFSSIPAGSKASPGELAEPLLACMLNHGEGLPEELGGLKAVVSKLGNAQAAGEVPDEKRKEKKKFERRNIFTAEDLDISRLRLKDGERYILLFFFHLYFLFAYSPSTVHFPNFNLPSHNTSATPSNVSSPFKHPKKKSAVKPWPTPTCSYQMMNLTWTIPEKSHSKSVFQAVIPKTPRRWIVMVKPLKSRGGISKTRIMECQIRKDTRSCARCIWMIQGCLIEMV